MAGLVDKFERHTHNLASEARAKPNRRQDKIDDARPSWEVGVGSNEIYRSNWDRIFGAKGRDSIQTKSEEPSL